MSDPKPPLPTLDPDDERIIQVFLERASAIVLDNSVLDARHWSSLVALAEELGLSDEQLRSTVNDLRERGVIKEIDLAPPKPPPLPEPGSTPAPPGSSPPAPQQEADFALTPPPEPPTAPPAVPDLEPAPASPVERFSERAQEIIAGQRGMGPRTHALLAATAAELGVTDEEAAAALRQFDSPAASSRDQRALAQSTPPPVPTTESTPPAPSTLFSPPSSSESEPSVPEPPPVGDDSSGEKPDSRRWRVQGEPPPEAPPPARKPAEIYRDYLEASLDQIENGVISRFLEKKFLKHGTGVLSLSSAFARHIFEDEVAARRYQLESAIVAEETSEGDEEDTLSDPDVQVFLDRSVPILAAHRGITAKSRVLLNAIAEELGLSQEQVESAIVAAQFRAATTQETADSKQQERLDGFRALVHGTLLSLPRKLLTRDVEEDLTRHGEELHGIDRALVRDAIREVAAELDISQISEGKARQHVERLIDAKLSETPDPSLPILPMDVRLRISSEGQQWGLTSDEVAEIINEKVRVYEQKRRAEQNFTRAALYAAGIAVMIVLGLFGWMVIRGGRVPEPVVEADPEESPIVVEEIDETKLDNDWWDTDLHTDVPNARFVFSSERESFKQLESRDPVVRQSAYAKVVKLLTDGNRTRQEAALIMRILAHAYQLEPDNEAAAKILEATLSLIPDTEDKLLANEQTYARSFLATPAAAVFVQQAEGERQANGVTEIGRAIDYSIDLTDDAPRLEKICHQQTAKRLMSLLVALAETNPRRAAEVHPFLVRAISLRDALDTRALSARNTDFLIAFLRPGVNSWEQFAPLIEQVIESEDAANAVRLLQIYEETGNRSLRTRMAELLLQRADVEVEDRDDVELVATAVRKALGISDVAMADDRTRHFLRAADTAIRQKPVDIGQLDEMTLQIVELTRLNTLGFAASRGEAGAATFQSLAEKEASDFLPDGDLFKGVEERLPGMEPSSHRLLNRQLDMLSNPRATAVNRADSVLSLSRLTESIDDLTPQQAAALAKYMLSRKRIEEHRVVVQHAGAIARWKQVRLAVADQLDAVELMTEDFEDLVSQMLGRKYTLPEGDSGRETLRIELLRSVLGTLKIEKVEDGNRFASYDQLANAMRDLYRLQAALLGVSELPSEVDSPTVIMPLLIEDVTKRVAAGPLELQQKQTLDRVATEVTAIGYLATSDLERQVLLDRSWLRLLAIQVAQERPRRKAQAASLLTQRFRQDAQSDNVMHQLRDGQRAILEMWVLRNRPE